MTVRNTLITVTIRVPSFLLSLSDIRLDTIVPPDMGHGYDAHIRYRHAELLLDNKIHTEDDIAKYLDLAVVGVIPEYQGGKRK